MTTFFIGSHYEVTAGVATKYYYAGSQRIAMRKNGTLYYMFSDHLGSTSITTDSAGNVISELRYKPWGETRYASGNTSTQYQYTGQFSYESDFGLYFYQSRFYDPSIGRFSSPDTIIPEQTQGTQAWDRYVYVNNSPINHTDPTGHLCEDEDIDGHCSGYDATLQTYALAGIETVSPTGGNERQSWWVNIYRKLIPGKDHTSYGPAKIFPEEAEKLGIDPNTDEGAFRGMQARIDSRMDACKGCSNTDKFIVAALGSDYNYSVNESHVASNSKDYKLKSGTHTIDWKDYLNRTQGDDQLSKDRDLISLFTSNVQELQSQGYYVPEDVDFDYILNELLPSLEP